jgi:hypothetical protein
MKNIDRFTRQVALAPRNPLVAVSHRRQAGPHGGSRKSERQRNRREVRAALRELHDGP